MKKVFLTFILAGFYFFFPHSSIAAGPTLINSSSINSHKIWTKANSPYVIADDVSVSFDLIIEQGAIIKFKNYGGLNILAGLTVVGTENEPIIFTSYKDDSFAGDTNGDGNATMPKAGDWDHINLYGGGTAAITIDHAKVFYGSPGNYVIGALSVNRNNNVTIRNSEIKYNGYIGILIYQAQPTIENNIISNNERGIIVWNNPGEVAKATNNSIVDNSFSGAGIIGSVSGERYMRLDARNNWWGDKSGPYYKHTTYGTDNLEGEGNRISDGVMYDPWLGKDPNKKRNPVILIPGIGAPVNLDTMIGGIMNDNWTLFSHAYDGIIEAFKSMDYEEGKDFFIAYYDWRQKNEESARDYLEPLIKKAVSLNGTSKVNIIAHSMGGLVARSYIQSDDYANDVDNLFLIGTPNMGSSDVYPVWEGGYVPENWANKTTMRWYLRYMIFKNTTFSYYEVVHNYIPSVKQLLPIYNYIHLIDNPNDIKDYSEMSEVNDFLVNLNNGIQLLNNRVKVSVVSGNEQATVNTIPVIVANESPFWLDGKPEPIDPVRNDANGDGRVLLSSAQIQSMFSDILVGNHGKIVSMAESIIAPRINEYLDIIYPSPEINDEMLVWVASPVDIEVMSPDGKIVSASLNEIPLAKYASESKPDGVKLISIPNPIAGEYEIKLVGNGAGEFHLGMEYADYTESKEDHSSVVAGSVSAGEAVEFVVAYNPEQINPIEDLKPKDDTPPTITGFPTTEPNENGWYNSDVIIHFEAEDDESGVDFITPDITVSTEGFNQEISGIAFDKASNSATTTISGINIDKTAPVIEPILPCEGEEYLRQDDLEIVFKASDNLSGIASTIVYLDGEKLTASSQSLFNYYLGEHILTIKAEDKAGNISGQKINFYTITDINGTIFDVEKLHNDQEIYKRLVKDTLVARLEWIKKHIEKYGQGQKKRNEQKEKAMAKCVEKKGADWCEDRLGEKFERINYHLDEIHKKIVKKQYEAILKSLDFYLRKKWLSQKAYDIIEEDIDFLINNK